MIKEGKVLVLFPNTGAPLFRKKDLKYIAHIRPSYKEEGRLLTAYALDTLKAQKGVMFYQDDAFGQGLLEGAQEELKKKGVSDWLAVPYIRNDVTFTKQISTIKNYDPDVILFFSTTTAAIGLVREMGIQEISAKPMLANSDFGEEKFLKFISEKGLKLIYINVVPNPQLSDLAIVQQFRDAAVKYEVKVDPFSLESYIATDFLLSILKKIPGAVTKEKLIDAIEQIKDYDYKGLKFNFDPENRTLSSTFWLYTGSPNWKQIELK
jgi:ABC-type branched-subunit amino acid transport system substrate-binding protein